MRGPVDCPQPIQRPSVLERRGRHGEDQRPIGGDPSQQPERRHDKIGRPVEPGRLGNLRRQLDGPQPVDLDLAGVQRRVLPSIDGTDRDRALPIPEDRPLLGAAVAAGAWRPTCHILLADQDAKLDEPGKRPRVVGTRLQTCVSAGSPPSLSRSRYEGRFMAA